MSPWPGRYGNVLKHFGSGQGWHQRASCQDRILFENIVTPSVCQSCHEAESGSDRFNTEIEMKEFLVETRQSKLLPSLTLKAGKKKLCYSENWSLWGRTSRQRLSHQGTQPLTEMQFRAGWEQERYVPDSFCFCSLISSLCVPWKNRRSFGDRLCESQLLEV